MGRLILDMSKYRWTITNFVGGDIIRFDRRSKFDFLIGGISGFEIAGVIGVWPWV